MLQSFLLQRYKKRLEGFKLVFGKKEHIQIAKIMGDIHEKEKKLQIALEKDKAVVKLQEEIASLQSKVIYLIENYE